VSYKIRFARFAAVASLLANSAYCLAAEPSTVSPATPDAAGQLEEIIVTAQKRQSPLQHTPVAITSVSSKELADQVIQQAQDLNNVVPGLQIYPILNSLQVSVRGLGATFLDPRGDPTVATSLDGLYFAKPIPNGTALFDLDRIEVLKGPQGTLYGRNAAVGALNLVTNLPVVGQYGGELQMDVGNLGLIGTQGVANLPISGDAAMRISFKTISRDGYIDHYYDDADSKALRVSAIWHATEELDIFAEANYAKIGGHGSTPLSWPCAGYPTRSPYPRHVRSLMLAARYPSLALKNPCRAIFNCTWTTTWGGPR
jgi:iron complex outermembrane receptor protein